MRLLAELKSRGVVRAASVYLVVAAGVWGAADIVAEALPVPPRFLTAVVLLSMAGLPFVLAGSWFFNVTREVAPGNSLPASPPSNPDTDGEGSTPLRGTKLLRLAVVALGGWGLFSVGWLVYDRIARSRLAVQEEQLLELADRDQFEEAYAMASRGRGLPADLESVWQSFSSRVTSVRSEPSGASVSRRPYDSRGDWSELGTTPLEDVWLPRGMSVLRFELDNYETIQVAYVPTSGDSFEVRLAGSGETPSGMVRIPPGRAAIPNFAWADMTLSDYLIGEFEVQNAEYAEFIAGGGYSDSTYWTDPLIDGTTPVPWRSAMSRFVDRTGRPGPATWEAGDYPDGEDAHPVQGVSWFEARAYARFRGMQLPTAFHWHRAAQVTNASYVVPASNFDPASGPLAVGASHALTGWGTYDMAGNVREWVANATGSQRFILGGAWNDFTYLFPLAYAEDPWDRSDRNGLRLASYADNAEAVEAARPLDLEYRDYTVERPVSDDAYEAIRSIYDYDPAPLNASVLARESFEDWVVETVSFDAAYSGQRVLANVYLPHDARPPFQAVVYMPGSGAVSGLGTLADLRSEVPVVDFLVKTGRAVILPAYDGTYERRHSDLTTSRADETYRHAEYREHWVKDLRRAVDYLESRSDIDPQRVAYFGSSWGGRVGGMMLALEERLRVGVLYNGGFRPERALPMADDINFVPRVQQPVLMVNGRQDHLRPFEASQLPFFSLLGSGPGRKEHKVFPGGHRVPRADLIRETLRWLDTHLGPVPSD